MKKILTIMLVGTPALPSFAKTGSSAFSGASDGIYGYIPYIQGLCFAIAAVIAIVGATATYMAMQTAPQQVTKRITMTVGSCLCCVSMAIALPQFFGYESYSTGDGSSSSSGGSTGSSDGFLSTDKGGISQSGIDTTIPSIRDQSGNWITFPPGTNMTIANCLMTIYDHMGSGVSGSYGRTLNYIQQEYRSGNIDYNTYQLMISAANSLPHN